MDALPVTPQTRVLPVHDPVANNVAHKAADNRHPAPETAIRSGRQRVSHYFFLSEIEDFHIRNYEVLEC